jgi:hypothetical protein
MVDSLIFVQTFVKIRFATARCPEEIPLMGLGVSEVVGLAKGSHKLRVTLQDLVKELAVIDMVSTLVGMTISRCWRSIH